MPQTQKLLCMKYLIYTFTILISQINLSFGQDKIQVKTSIIIEKESVDTKELGLIIEDTDYEFYFEFEDKYKWQGEFVNPHIFAYAENLDVNRPYNLIISLRTSDSVIHLSKNIILDNTLSGANIICFIGKNKNDKSIIKSIEIEKYVNNLDNLKIEMLDEPTLNNSPRFNLINNTNDTIYPANCINSVRRNETCASSFYGVLYKNNGYGGFAQYSPFSFCKMVKENEQEFILPKSKGISYTSNKEECTIFEIKEKGEYLFSLNISPSEIKLKNENISNESIFQVKTIYVLSHKFEVN